MRLLRRRHAGDCETIAAAVRASLSALQPGLRLLAAPATAGDVAVDVVAVDARGRLILIVCEPVATPATIARGLEAAQWWQEHRQLARRVFGDPALDPALPPRAMVVAGRFGERAQRVLRALGVMAPLALSCELFEDAGQEAVCLEWLGSPPPDARGAPETAPRTPPADSPAESADQARRAAALIERLERLRFREVFR